MTRPSTSTHSMATVHAVLALLLLFPSLMTTTAFSSSLVTFVAARGNNNNDNKYNNNGIRMFCPHSGALRGGARLLVLTSRLQKQPWRRQSSAAANLSEEVSGFTSNSTKATTATTTTDQFDESTSTTASTIQTNDEIATKKEKPFLRRIDGIVFMSYLANVMALSLPVLLVPIAATEQATSMALSSKAAATMVAAQVASISSIASLGGAVGKFVNGFICKELGSYFCSKTYLAGLGVCSFAFSLSPNPTIMSVAFAGMEFFASIQWASLAVMLSSYYAKEPVRLAAALTALGLSSTSGQILAKFLGMTLTSSAMHWRQVAQLGALVAFGGAALISRAPGRESATLQQQTKPPFEWRSVTESLRAVLGSPLFLMLGLAHSMAFVARGTDRILGTFFQEMAALPPSISGGLTLSITLGLVQGLISGAQKFSKCSDLSQKRNFLKKRYLLTVAATFGLTALSKVGAAGMIANRYAMSTLVALVSFVVARNISFQYFQFPAMIAQNYGDHKAVVISFLDGFGFLLSAPIFATISKVVPRMGWGSGWTMLATLFGAAALLMMHAIDPILNLTKTPAEEEKTSTLAGGTAPGSA